MREDKMPNNNDNVRSIVRAFSILEAISKANGEKLGIQDLATATKLSKATAYRIASTLVTLQYIEKDENNKYRLGLKLISLSAVVLNNLQLVDVAKSELHELAQEIGLTAHLGTIDGNDLLYLSKANSNNSIRTTSYVGQRSYLHSTSLGKALCAFLPKEQVIRIVKEKGMPQFTPNTITKIENYLLELDKVKTQGYAIDDEENEKFVRCVAAPIFDHTGKVIAAISVSGLIVHIPEAKLPKAIETVMSRALDISKKMGYPDNSKRTISE
ncbi:MAG: IclR family transcriptional regulator [Anaerolineaceae bacterium]|nr:IclR family transcriptional regulator [Anaerolineaceae bacterium]